MGQHLMNWRSSSGNTISLPRYQSITLHNTSAGTTALRISGVQITFVSVNHYVYRRSQQCEAFLFFKQLIVSRTHQLWCFFLLVGTSSLVFNIWVTFIPKVQRGISRWSLAVLPPVLLLNDLWCLKYREQEQLSFGSVVSEMQHDLHTDSHCVYLTLKP